MSIYSYSKDFDENKDDKSQHIFYLVKQYRVVIQIYIQYCILKIYISYKQNSQF